jgi:hypothetical protein
MSDDDARQAGLTLSMGFLPDYRANNEESGIPSSFVFLPLLPLSVKGNPQNVVS